MFRSDLVNWFADRFSQSTTKDAELAVKKILEAIGEAVSEVRRIELRGFGSCSLNLRPPRTAYNPQTRAPVVVPEKHVPHFKAGKEMRERIDAGARGAGPQEGRMWTFNRTRLALAGQQSCGHPAC